jgi:hypothetical protein
MPVFVDRTGFPFWGNPYPQKSKNIPAGQIQTLIQDAAINQIPQGRADEINLKQIPRPKQAKIEGASAGDLVEIGKFGSNLYDQFMTPYIMKGKTP